MDRSYSEASARTSIIVTNLSRSGGDRLCSVTQNFLHPKHYGSLRSPQSRVLWAGCEVEKENGCYGQVVYWTTTCKVKKRGSV